MTTPSPPSKVSDEDLAEQAHPGHGIPSQDPDLAAQFVLSPSETERETESALVGGAMAAGAGAGAGLGALVGGPVGWWSGPVWALWPERWAARQRPPR